jgi:ABC-type antimicrobial peptide transport system permease subunit
VAGTVASPEYLQVTTDREGVALRLLALAPSLVLGTWVAGRLGDAVAAGLFDLPVRITSVSYLGTALGLMAVILIALALPLRRVARLDLASSTKTLT